MAHMVSIDESCSHAVCDGVRREVATSLRERLEEGVLGILELHV